MVGYDAEYTPNFTLKSNRKRKTDAFLPTAPANYSLAPRETPMPDFSGGTHDNEQIPMSSALSTLSGIQAKPQGNTNQNAVITGTPQEKKGIYDDWKQPVFGNMPLDKFVQLTGMMANAVAPNEWSGRLGRDMANMAGQAGMDRRDYEEREQQRADINKKYEEQQKEKRMEQALKFAAQTNNAPLAKAAYGKYKEQWQQDFGVDLPDWNPEATPTVMSQLQKYREGAKELGLSSEDIKKGEAEVLLDGGLITGDQYMKWAHPDEKKEDSDITSNVGVNPKTGKPEFLKKSGEFSGVTPYTKPEKVSGGGGEDNKAVKTAETRLNTYLRRARSDRDKVAKLLEQHPEGDPKHNDLLRKLEGWDANVAQAEETLSMLQGGELRPEGIQWGGNNGTTKQKTLDAVTAAKILQEAGGDKNKARNIAKQRGYSF